MNIRERYTAIINGMKSEDKLVQWETMVKWCTLWIEEEKKELKPLLELIKEFKNIGFWEDYYPSQSHRALGLSIGKNYDERYQLPMVYIRYNAEGDSFDIQYQKGQGGETFVTVCIGALAKSDLKKIVDWLDDTKKNSRTIKSE